ncbi:MAG: hypothetical protein IKR04_04245 [Clostridia bacterium]|nr:hypothetical protein [Clostridia bacterium]
MDFILDLLIDLVLEDGIEASQNKKIPKGLRYVILTAVILIYAMIIGLVVWFGITTLKESVVFGVGIIIFAVVFAVLCIIKFVNAYKRKQTDASRPNEKLNEED